MKTKNKILVISFIIIMLFTLTACDKDGKKDSSAKDNLTDALKFKDEYESLNGTDNSSGKVHRSVTIAEDNPFVYITAEELVQKIENSETFYVYFGSKLCPWCRSVIEKAIEVADQKGITTIYYIDIWDDDGNEILRDKYVLEDDGELTLDHVGIDAYYMFLEYFDSVLSDYTLTDSDGNKVDVQEKRIYAPSFVYVEKGEAIRLIEGISSKQTDSREELNAEILADEEEIFNNFFE